MAGAWGLLHRIWYGPEADGAPVVPAAVARGLAGCFALVVGARNRYHDRRSGKSVPGVRVVSVGNLLVGGAGKTPVASWLARWMGERGVEAAVVSRGYGGDEVLLQRAWHPEIPVITDANRSRGVSRAGAGGAEVVVLDDGFQHRRVARDVDVVLLPAEGPVTGALLPRGPFREPASALRRATAVVVVRRTACEEASRSVAAWAAAEFPHLVVARARLALRGWRRLDGSAVAGPRGDVLAFAGIARPELFAAGLEEEGLGVELVAFPDHFVYGPEQAALLRRRGGARTLVTTEKDAVKLEGVEGLLGDVRVAVQEVEWEEGWGALRSHLEERIGLPGVP